MQDAPAERRARGKLVIDVQRIYIAGDLDESTHIILGEGLNEADVLADFEVFDACRGHETTYTSVM